MEALVRYDNKMHAYKCYTLEHGIVNIGVPVAHGRNQSLLVQYGQEDGMERGDYFRLAILTHALDANKGFDHGQFQPVSQAAKNYCSVKKQSTVTKDVLAFLCLAKLENDNSVSRLSILCSTPGTMAQIDRALEVLCERLHGTGAPVDRIDQLVPAPGDEPSYALPSLWFALRALERLKVLELPKAT